MARNDPRPFLITTLSKQPDEASKTNARRYAMRGKNSGKSRKQVAKNPRPASWINQQSHAEPRPDSKPVANQQAYTNRISRQIASEWTMFQFAGEVGPHTRQTFVKFFRILELSTYPNPVLAGSDLDRQAPSWFTYLGQSQAYFHTQLFVITVYSDIIDNGTDHLGPVATQHMTRALGLLQKDLAAIHKASIGATLSSIIAFSMVAFIIGDTGTAEKHLHGLFKLTNTLGGIHALKPYGFLQAKSCRLDLSYAMDNKSKPLFFADNNISWSCYLPRSTKAPRNTAIHLLLEDSTPDPRLVNIWHDLYEFSRAANIATQTGRKLESELLQEVIISIQYRLLHLQYDNDDPHELPRLVLLAYSTTILPSLFSHFSTASSSSIPLSSYLQDLSIMLAEASQEKLKVLLWLLFIVGTSGSDDKLVEVQLSQVLKALDLNSWDKVLGVLKEFLWIDILHKDLAQVLFDNTL